MLDPRQRRVGRVEGGGTEPGSHQRIAEERPRGDRRRALGTRDPCGQAPGQEAECRHGGVGGHEDDHGGEPHRGREESRPTLLRGHTGSGSGHGERGPCSPEEVEMEDHAAVTATNSAVVARMAAAAPNRVSSMPDTRRRARAAAGRAPMTTATRTAVQTMASG